MNINAIACLIFILFIVVTAFSLWMVNSSLRRKKTMRKNIIACLIFMLFIVVIAFSLWMANTLFRRSFPTDSQFLEMSRLTEDVNNDVKLKDLFKTQNVKFEDIKRNLENGKLFLYLYVDSERFDVNSILERIREIALKDDLKSLGKIISVKFYYGTHETAPSKPFAVKDIFLDKAGISGSNFRDTGDKF